MQMILQDQTHPAAGGSLHTRPLRALLWKDFRINRQILIVGVVLWVTPHLSFLVAKMYVDMLAPVPLMAVMCWAAKISIVLSMLTVALIGGNVISAEYLDRSAVFLAYLAPSRQLALASKAICGVVPGVVAVGINLGMCRVASPEFFVDGLSGLSLQALTMVSLATATLIFGGAWLGGVRFKSAALGTGFGLAMPVGILATTGLALMKMVGHDRDFVGWYITAAFIVGVLCFLGGCACYLRGTPDV